MCRQSATVCLVKSPTRQHRATGPLAERLATLADPRCRRGKRHPFVAVLLTACSAVVCGAKSFAAINEWAADAPQDVLARLGARTATALAVRVPPSGATIRRVINGTCPGGLADLLGHDPASAGTLALDGKSARGSRRGTTPAAHLPAAMTGTGMTVTQLRVPEKTNEITCFAALLDPFDLAGVTVTGDALHTVADHARCLHRRGAFGLFPVKENRSALFVQLDALDWDETTNAAITVHRTEETNSGRHEIRIVRVQPLAPGQVNFPHATRALLVERYTTGRGDGKIHADAELGITTAPSTVADTVALARCVRDQWAIEAQHFVRDVTFGEDACRARTGSLLRALAAFRSLAISLAHLAGWTNNAAAHDHYRNHPADALRELGLTG